MSPTFLLFRFGQRVAFGTVSLSMVLSTLFWRLACDFRRPEDRAYGANEFSRLRTPSPCAFVLDATMRFGWRCRINIDTLH